MTARVVYSGGSSYTVGGVCFKLGRPVKVTDAALIERLKTTRHFSITILKDTVDNRPTAAPRKAVVAAEDPTAPVKIPSSRKKHSKLLKKSKPAQVRLPAPDLEIEE